MTDFNEGDRVILARTHRKHHNPRFRALEGCEGTILSTENCALAGQYLVAFEGVEGGRRFRTDGGWLERADD